MIWQGDTHMKAMKLPKEIKSFLDVAETAEEETRSLLRRNDLSLLWSLSERWTESRGVEY